MRIARSWWVVALGALGLSGRGMAADGITEINQVVAQTGAVSGSLAEDPAGFPVRITRPGSYRLTSDLVVSDLATTAVSIAIDGVSLDLNGFAVRGPNSCAPGACSGFGAGNGIAKETLLDNRKRIAVHDGTVSGVGGNGLALGDEAQVRNVAVANCGGNGVVVGAHSVVLGNRIVSNRQRGLFLGSDSAFADNVIALAGLGGVAGFTESVVGGVATGGNVCDDGRCSPVPARRRYYLTRSLVIGAQADESGTCAPGFHFASLWEILDPTQLQYDTVLGLVRTDSGSGPPTGGEGWIRTGWNAHTASDPSVQGRVNCEGWSAANSLGSTLSLDSQWDDGNPLSSDVPPWIPSVSQCSLPRLTWCVQD